MGGGVKRRTRVKIMNEEEIKEVLSLLREMKKDRLSHEEIAILRELIKAKKYENEIKKAVLIKILSGTAWAVVSGIALAASFGLWGFLVDAYEATKATIN